LLGVAFGGNKTLHSPATVEKFVLKMTHILTTREKNCGVAVQVCSWIPAGDVGMPMAFTPGMQGGIKTESASAEQSVGKRSPGIMARSAECSLQEIAMRGTTIRHGVPLVS
jgi:hypothetical protein